jgi:hypothetical protein
VTSFAGGYLLASWRVGGEDSALSLGSSSDSDSERGRESVSHSLSSQERRIAKLCAEEALKVRGQDRARPSRSRATSVEEPSEVAQTSLRDQVDEIFVLVEDKGLWSRGAGAKARFLLSQLPVSDTTDLRRRLDEATESGAVQLQAGAWLPQRTP